MKEEVENRFTLRSSGLVKIVLEFGKYVILFCVTDCDTALFTSETCISVLFVSVFVGKITDERRCFVL